MSVAAFGGLPQPRHLYAAATRSRHFHLGLFGNGCDSLAVACDRLLERMAPHCRPAGRLLDIGCGAGGSTAYFGRRGHDCLGLDPCGRSIALARGFADRRCRYDADDFAGAQRLTPAAFDTLLMVEVGQYLPDLEAVMAKSFRLLRPGGTLVLADVAANEPVDFRRVPFHLRGARRTAALASGFRIVQEDQLGDAVQPTFGHLHRELERLRPWFAFHWPARDSRSEVDELQVHCGHLSRAFASGKLGYELLVVRRP